MLERKVFTKNELGERLAGIESRPNEPREKYSAVILVHGFSQTKAERGKFDKLVRRFTKVS